MPHAHRGRGLRPLDLLLFTYNSHTAGVVGLLLLLVLLKDVYHS